MSKEPRVYLKGLDQKHALIFNMRCVRFLQEVAKDIVANAQMKSDDENITREIGEKKGMDPVLVGEAMDFIVPFANIIGVKIIAHCQREELFTANEVEQLIDEQKKQAEASVKHTRKQFAHGDREKLNGIIKQIEGFQAFTLQFCELEFKKIYQELLIEQQRAEKKHRSP